MLTLPRSVLALVGLAYALTGCDAHQSSVPTPLLGQHDMSGGSALCLSGPCIYVSTFGGPLPIIDGRVLMYQGSSNGDVPPVANISGARTKIYRPLSLAVGSDHTIYSANYQSSTMTAYAPGVYGDRAPEYILGGLVTQIDQPTGIAVDPQGRTYLSNGGGAKPSITVFEPGAKHNHPPTQWIRGAKTGLRAPEDIAVDLEGDAYVADLGDGAVRVFRAGTKGDIYPTQTIIGNKTGLACPLAIAVDATKRIYVADTCGPSGYTDRILVFAAGGKGNISPIAIIGGSQTMLSGPSGIALDASGNIYVANGGSGGKSVTVFAPGSDGNVAPIRIISGYKTKLKESSVSVSGIAVL